MKGFQFLNFLGGREGGGDENGRMEVASSFYLHQPVEATLGVVNVARDWRVLDKETKVKKTVLARFDKNEKKNISLTLTLLWNSFASGARLIWCWKSYGLGHPPSVWQFLPGTRLMKGITSLSTKEPKPIWKSVVMFWTAAAISAPSLTCGEKTPRI